MIPKVVAFDLDGTLAISKGPLSERMSALLTQLCAATNVAVMSGGKIEQFQKQIVERMDTSSRFEHLFLFPTSGASLFVFKNGAWIAEYQETISPEEAERIKKAIEETLVLTGVLDPTAPRYGELSEYRGSQVTFSALGQEAPVEEKYAWDPDQEKRRKMVGPLTERLPGHSIKIGGTTSIDITREGINKAYGLRKLSTLLSIHTKDMLYIGDALFEGGNDEVVKETGIPTRQVKDPTETERVIEELLSTP